MHLSVWAYSHLQAPRTQSGATLGQVKACLHVQRSGTACQGGPQLVRVCSCAPGTQITCVPGRDGTRVTPRMPSLVEALPGLLLQALPGGSSTSPVSLGAPWRPLSSVSLSLCLLGTTHTFPYAALCLHPLEPQRLRLCNGGQSQLFPDRVQSGAWGLRWGVAR